MHNVAETKRTIILVTLILVARLPASSTACGHRQQLRGNLCCLSEKCEDTDFLPCTVNNTKDSCVPCDPGYYLTGTYDTFNFPEPGQCVPFPECSSDEIRNEDGKCECDRTNGYYPDGGICRLSDVYCTRPGEELGVEGKCSSCKDGYFKPLAGSNLCKEKSRCYQNQTIIEGDTKTDRQCMDIDKTSLPPDGTTTKANTTNDADALAPEHVVPIVGVLVTIAIGIIIAIILWCVYKRRKQSASSESDEENAAELVSMMEIRRYTKRNEHTDDDDSEKPDSPIRTRQQTVFYNGSPLVDRKNKAEPFDKIPGESEGAVGGKSAITDDDSIETDPKQLYNDSTEGSSSPLACFDESETFEKTPFTNNNADQHPIQPENNNQSSSGTNTDRIDNQSEHTDDENSEKPELDSSIPIRENTVSYNRSPLVDKKNKAEPFDKIPGESEGAVGGQSAITDEDSIETDPKQLYYASTEDQHPIQPENNHQSSSDTNTDRIDDQSEPYNNGSVSQNFLQVLRDQPQSPDQQGRLVMGPRSFDVQQNGVVPHQIVHQAVVHHGDSGFDSNSLPEEQGQPNS